jgi:hypothetical protein
MLRSLAAAALAVLSTPLFAAAEESVAASAPAETVSVVYVIIFGILFVGMIVGFFVYMWWNESHKKPEDGR